jgi:hypothetical protein
MKTSVTVSLSLWLLAACGSDFGTATTYHPPSGGVTAPPSIEAVSSRDLSGASGNYLADPLVVRIRNSEGAMPGVTIAWRVSGGQGELASAPGAALVPAVTITDGEGIARIFFRPLSEGIVTVTASTGWQGVTVSFTVIVSRDQSVMVINFGPIFDCYGTPYSNDPSEFDGPKDSIPVGLTVEFVYAPYLSYCSAEVVSVSVPPGAAPYDSGIIPGGGRADLKLDVAGDWTFEDKLNGGRVTLRVR